MVQDVLLNIVYKYKWIKQTSLIFPVNIILKLTGKIGVITTWILSG